MRKSVCLLSADREVAEHFHEAMGQEKELSLQYLLRDGVGLFELLIRQTPDILVVYMALPEVDMLDVIEMLGHIPMQRRPLLFALCDLMTPAIMRLLQSRVTYCFVKPIDYAYAVEQLVQLARLELSEPCPRQAQLALLDRVVSEHLFGLGLSPHLKGFHYLREAIKLVASVRAPAKLSVMKHLYPAVSALCGAQPSVVEHAMRNAIASAWVRGDLKMLQGYFGYTVDEVRATPSNSAFIFMVADRVHMQLIDEADPHRITDMVLEVI